MLDGQTTFRLAGLRLRGARCLEAGTGAGAIACWLAAKVGPHGHVLATDLRPMSIPDHPRLEVVQHDIVNEPVPDGPWDVIHARLLLQRLPGRHELLTKLATALAPAGALVVEDWDMTWRVGPILHAPTLADMILLERFHEALVRVFVAAGIDRGWASRVPAAMLDAGLIDVSAQIHTQSWPGRSAGAQLLDGIITELNDQLRAHDLADEELSRVRELMSDPQMILRMPPLVSTVGYRTGSPTGLRRRP